MTDKYVNDGERTLRHLLIGVGASVTAGSFIGALLAGYSFIEAAWAPIVLAPMFATKVLMVPFLYRAFTGGRRGPPSSHA